MARKPKLGGRRVRAPHHKTGPETKSVNLALQGGGAHGAYTWGVLDRLLEEERLFIDGISGTSAGAMNAAVLAMGMSRDGRAGGKAALEGFWRDIAAEGRWGPFSRLPFERFLNGWNTEIGRAHV